MLSQRVGKDAPPTFHVHTPYNRDKKNGYQLIQPQAPMRSAVIENLKSLISLLGPQLQARR